MENYKSGKAGIGKSEKLIFLERVENWKIRKVKKKKIIKCKIGKVENCKSGKV